MDVEKAKSALTVEQVTEWWETEITDIAPGVIRIRGYAIEDLIGRIGFADMIWLTLRGELPTKAQARLFEAMLVSAVDHGPQAPSIAIGRMAATCGVGINSAMASGINALGDGRRRWPAMHGIARNIHRNQQAEALASVKRSGVSRATWHLRFGLRPSFSCGDPRAKRCPSWCGGPGCNLGRYPPSAKRWRANLAGNPVPRMNVDGIMAVVLSELGSARIGTWRLHLVPQCRNLRSCL
jgi:citrate synthase